MSTLEFKYTSEYIHGDNRTIELKFHQKKEQTVEGVIENFNLILKAMGYVNLEVDLVPPEQSQTDNGGCGE